MASITVPPLLYGSKTLKTIRTFSLVINHCNDAKLPMQINMTLWYGRHINHAEATYEQMSVVYAYNYLTMNNNRWPGFSQSPKLSTIWHKFHVNLQLQTHAAPPTAMPATCWTLRCHPTARRSWLSWASCSWSCSRSSWPRAANRAASVTFLGRGRFNASGHCTVYSFF